MQNQLASVYGKARLATRNHPASLSNLLLGGYRAIKYKSCTFLSKCQTTEKMVRLLPAAQEMEGRESGGLL